MYSVEYINCKVCGNDDYKILGIRGNREYAGAMTSQGTGEHITTNVVRCRRCGFVYTNPLISAETNSYEDPSYYQSSSSVEAEVLFNYILRAIERYVLKGRLLDVGCGKGEFLSVAKKRGWQVNGLEPSVNLARFASDNSGLDVKTSSLKEAGYPRGYFDAVSLNMVLEHVDDPADLLADIQAVLKKDGLLFIEVPNMDSLMLNAAAWYFRFRGKNWSPLLSPLHYPFHCYGYNPSSIGCLLKRQGFSVKKIHIRDSLLRGFRPDSKGTFFEKAARNGITRIAGFLGRGDVMMVFANKLE